MRKSISFWQMLGFIVTSIAGTMLHFLFNWTGQQVPVALFSAVNESIWEHTKLIYYPMLLFGWVEHLYTGKELPQFWCVKLMGILLALILIPSIYYTYTGILGKSADWFNIAIFYISAGAAFRLETHAFRQSHPCRISTRTAILCLLLISLLFIFFTFYPPHIPFFQDPLSGSYGYIAAHPLSNTTRIAAM